jgi:hypothetical protein
MCLEKLDNISITPYYGNDDIYMGYKRFKKPSFRSKKLKYESIHTYVKFNEWLEANQCSLLTELQEPYTSGFHIYLDIPPLESALEVVVPVHFKDIIVTGWQSDFKTRLPTAVARYMYVPGSAACPIPKCRSLHRWGALKVLNSVNRRVVRKPSSTGYLGIRASLI